MSRLYLKAMSDSRKSEVTSRGHQEITASLYWGSKHDSKLAVRVTLKWSKENDEPTAYVESELDNTVLTRGLK